MDSKERYKLIEAWVDQSIDSSICSIKPVNSDASFRNFSRVYDNQKKSYILMDSPPEKENNEQFVMISGMLQKMGILSPKIIKKDLQEGLLLLSDLGQKTLLDKNISTPKKLNQFYGEAINILVSIQAHGIAFQEQLPKYNSELLHSEMNLFSEWYCRKELAVDSKTLKEFHFKALFNSLSSRALGQKQVFVHRDYHSRNIIVSDTGQLGIVDFQDAVEGPITYDCVSLLRDCYYEFSDKDIDHWLSEYYQQLSSQRLVDCSFESFKIDFDLMGVQRHLKAIGIFSRLKHRDNKSNYIKDIPRTFSYLDKVSARYDFLQPLNEFIRFYNLQ